MLRKAAPYAAYGVVYLGGVLLGAQLLPGDPGRLRGRRPRGALRAIWLVACRPGEAGRRLARRDAAGPRPAVDREQRRAIGGREHAPRLTESLVAPAGREPDHDRRRVDGRVGQAGRAAARRARARPRRPRGAAPPSTRRPAGGWPPGDPARRSGSPVAVASHAASSTAAQSCSPPPKGTITPPLVRPGPRPERDDGDVRRAARQQLDQRVRRRLALREPRRRLDEHESRVVGARRVGARPQTRRGRRTPPRASARGCASRSAASAAVASARPASCASSSATMSSWPGRRASGAASSASRCTRVEVASRDEHRSGAVGAAGLPRATAPGRGAGSPARAGRARPPARRRRRRRARPGSRGRPRAPRPGGPRDRGRA